MRPQLHVVEKLAATVLALGVAQVAYARPNAAHASATPREEPGGSATKYSISAAAVTASADDGDVPANTVDGDPNTRWSASGDPQWIQYDLGRAGTVSYVKIAWYRGDTRTELFDVQVSNDGETWTTALPGVSSGGTSTLETYDFTDVTARYVRLLGHGNTSNLWNSIAETEIWGTPGSAAVAAPTFNPDAGAYSSAQSITISSTTSGAAIRYTLDGSTPTATTGTLYSGPVTISSTATLQAIAYESGMTDSSITSARYAISPLADRSGQDVRYFGHANTVCLWNSQAEGEIWGY